MTGDRMSRVSEILEEALTVDVARRSPFLDRACGGDDEIRAEVESLLAAHERAGDAFLDRPWFAAVAAGVDAGRTIGVYRLLQRIGHGGMGDVFAAMRADGQYEQKVALKIVRAGYSGADIVERFRAERQILAGLDHPNIARLFDGGATDQGAPYLVMELVDGVPIDEFCRARSLAMRERLALFLQVCSAVQYAHQRLVIHRDIKPSNVLVTEQGVPKLLDFGIAKMLDTVGSSPETVLRPFTPEYASPEQVRGEAVSTASDVYSLGVVLYQLLTGRSPYRLQTGTTGELAQAITSRDPERPSTAVLRDADDAAADSALPRRQRELRGDLDAILLKALRKEPEQRYSSVEQFGDDIRRHLDGQPVAARKGTWSYVTAKFVRRHRVGVAAAALVLLTIAAGVTITLREARIAEANRRRAEARFNDVRKLANSLLFEVHESIRFLPGSTDARKLILERSLQYLDSLAKESGNEPDLVRELATAYSRIGALQGDDNGMNLGETDAALASFQKAFRMRETLARVSPASHRDQVEWAVSLLDYGEYEWNSAGNTAGGFEYVERAIGILERERAALPDNLRAWEQSVRAITDRGWMQVGEGLSGRVGTIAGAMADFGAGRALTQRALVLAPESPAFLGQQMVYESGIGDAYVKLGDRTQALAHYATARGLADAFLARKNSIFVTLNRAVVEGRIGEALLIDGRDGEAVPHFDTAHRVVSGLANGDTRNEFIKRLKAITDIELGYALVHSGRVAAGMPYIREAFEIIAADTNRTALKRSIEAFIRSWYGAALERQGQIGEAVIQYRTIKDQLEAARRNGATDVRLQGYRAAAGVRLGAAFLKLGGKDDAQREFDEAQQTIEPLLAADPADFELAYVLAETFTAKGSMAAAAAKQAASGSERRAQWEHVRAWLGKSLAVWRRIPNPAPFSTSGFEVTVPSKVNAQLAECDRQIAALAGTR